MGHRLPGGGRPTPTRRSSTSRPLPIDPDTVEPTDPAYDPVEEAYQRSLRTPDPRALKDESRTDRGLLALMIGFSIAWIPIIQLFGALFVLVGFVLIFLGRKSFGASHARNVVLAEVLYILAFLAIVVVTYTFVGAVQADLSTAGATAPQVGSELRSQFDGFVAELGALALLLLFGQVLLVYGLAQGGTRIILGATFLAACLFLFVGLGFVISQVNVLLDQLAYPAYATQNPPASFGQDVGLAGMLSVVPDLLFVLAYARVRKDVRSRAEEIDMGPPPSPLEGRASLFPTTCAECGSRDLYSVSVLRDGPPYHCRRCGHTGPIVKGAPRGEPADLAAGNGN